MKRTKLVVMSCLLAMNLWTQSYTTINIPRESKINVVKTLFAYPLVLKELDLTEQLLDSQKHLNSLHEFHLNNKEKEVLNLRMQLKLSDHQNKLLINQIRNQKIKTFKLLGVGAASFIGLVLLAR